MSVWSEWRSGDCPLLVEYTSRNKRVVKTFTSVRAAKAFYVAKAKAGKDPVVRKAEPPAPSLWDLAVRYWGDEVDPLRPQVVCPLCRHRLDWHDVTLGCIGRVGSDQCGCLGPDNPPPAA